MYLTQKMHRRTAERPALPRTDPPCCLAPCLAWHLCCLWKSRSGRGEWWVGGWMGGEDSRAWLVTAFPLVVAPQGRGGQSSRPPSNRVCAAFALALVSGEGWWGTPAWERCEGRCWLQGPKPSALSSGGLAEELDLARMPPAPGPLPQATHSPLNSLKLSPPYGGLPGKGTGPVP